jgi:hypothetical protein
MSPLLILIVVVVVAAAAWYLFLRPGAPGLGGGGTGGPVPIGTSGAGPQPTPAAGVPITPDLGALKPGDAVSFWDGTDCVVLGSLDCRELVAGRATEWRWVFLGGNRLLELMPHGQALYDRSALHRQGGEFYELLVGRGGVLKRFEANVREGIAHEPVLVKVGDVDYRVCSTGTFAATRVGQLPAEGEVWSDVSQNPDDNVYFKLVRADDADPKDVVLGVWTTHIAILHGRTIDRSEITNVFAK